MFFIIILEPNIVAQKINEALLRFSFDLDNKPYYVHLTKSYF